MHVQMHMYMYIYTRFSSCLKSYSSNTVAGAMVCTSAGDGQGCSSGITSVVLSQILNFTMDQNLRHVKTSFFF